jgi:hypothetical protein
MPPEVFADALDYLGRSGIRQLPLLGGEPTIHPLFCRFIDMIEQRGLELLLFSNGHMPAKALARLRRFPAQRLKILLNIDPAACKPEPEDKGLRQVLESFGEALVPGCTLHHPGLSPAPFLPLIKKFGLAQVIRLGLAHPCVGAENRFLHPRHYRTVGRGLGIFAHQALDQGVRMELDCGFVPCMFSKEDLELFSTAELPGARCNPLPDLLPDGQAIPCYPLAQVCQTACLPGDTSLSVRERLSERLAVYAQTGIYGECVSCPLRRQALCNGGCRAAALQRLRPFPCAGRVEPQQPAAPSAGTRTRRVPGPEPGADKEQWAIPYIDQPLSFWQEIYSKYASVIQEVYLPLPRSLLASGRPTLPDGHLETFLRQVPFPVSVLLNPVVLPRPAASLAAPLIAALKDLQAVTRLNSVTLADLSLAQSLKEQLPELPLNASVLMDVTQPHQAHQLAGLFETLVPASRIMRNYAALQALRRAFPGTLRLIVNEGCLPDCLMRTQHFYEMGYAEELPLSLCEPLLEKHPWMRLTGAWVLPQHLQFFDSLTRAFKLAGRASLQDPGQYLHVLDAYIHRRALTPDAIGGGPASPLTPLHISDAYYRATLHCDKHCHSCNVCREYYAQAQHADSP